MNTSARSYLRAGVAAFGACAIAVAATVAPPPDVGISPAAPKVVSKAMVELRAAVQHMAPVLVLPQASQTPTTAAAVVAAGPAVQNAASDFIVNAWNAVLPWIDYGVDLTDYVLGFIPGISVLGDQISIVYYSLVRPVANSFVVNLVAPIVNDPLNPAVYVNGLITLGSVTVTSLINLGINEFNYFFGWLIPPIPPIPLAAPTSTTAAAQTLTATGAVAADLPASATKSTEEASDTGAEVEVKGRKKSELDTVKEPKSTGVAAQGEVRGASNENTTEATKVSSGDKKGGKGPTAEDASAKHDNDGAKKDGTGKAE
jgi:hypothetical protein